MRALGSEATFLRVGVSRQAQVKAMVAATVAAYRQLDCAFDNAGNAIETSGLTECDESVFDRTMSQNVKGVWLCLKLELEQMEDGGFTTAMPRQVRLARATARRLPPLARAT